MDVVYAVNFYVEKIVSSPTSMKALLLDQHTTPIISLAATQSSLLANHVYLTDRVDNPRRERMPHLQCVVFVRPTEDSLEWVGKELEQPRYGGYYLYFSNTLTKTAIERLAAQDTYELVHEVQEHFADYLPVLPYLFSLNYTPSPPNNFPLYALSSSSLPSSTSPAHLTLTPQSLQHHLATLSALLLSLKKKPTVIRHERSSTVSRALAVAMRSHLAAEQQLFDFRASAGTCVLLLLDRLEDPVTPLLMQWTYQAMVHELLGIHNGRVDMSSSPSVNPQMREVTLTPQTDPFLAQHLHTPFGDLSVSLQAHVAQYSQKSASANKLDSVEDMKRFVEEYPEFRRMGGNVSKHVEIVGEMSRLVGRDNCLESSEVEQEINVQRIVQNPNIPPMEKLRISMLYALRHQTNPQSSIGSLPAILSQAGVPASDVSLISTLLTLSGSQRRQADLFLTSSFLARGKSALKALKGAENVYTQHTPYLAQTLEAIVKGRLREQQYPFVEGGGPNATLQRPQDVIVFFLGGTTYEESKVVAQMNVELQQQAAMQPGSGSGTRILLASLPNPTSLPATASGTTPMPAGSPTPKSPPASNAPALNLQLGSLNLSTMEDVKIKTRTGALLTLISAIIIVFFTLMEFVDYRRIHLETSVVVDRSRGEKLLVNMNITFPRVPCYLLGLDVMDISGEHQHDVTHNMQKVRLSHEGVPIPDVLPESGLQNDLEKAIIARGGDECGSCYGGEPPPSGCCNTCEEVREAYMRRGWSFGNPDEIKQCVNEGWTEKIKTQSQEGCNISGRVRVNKVIGNFHFSPGKSFQTNAMHVHDLVPYLKDANHHDFGHQIHYFAFESDGEQQAELGRLSKSIKTRLGIDKNPLDGVKAHTEESNYMFQYFLKVVSTKYEMLAGTVVNSHQYSVTGYERDLSKGDRAQRDEHGTMTSHGVTGIPGAFFNFEISPMVVVHQETRQSFAHFLTSTCAIVGGVLTVAGIIDSMLFATERKLKKGSSSTYTNGSGLNGGGYQKAM
ncbi:Sec1-like protein [Calocera viscosa TUFC12733]|uniref:Sec1-like protein n=1 Tax=Calocera viscosa (strain TUFC12733) TaxID=1330018 RepID=A0A167MT52_CALVF|nr:Sec1-like protein [Calocera viscosa TUFC12733]